MKLILMLVALLVVALLVTRQIDGEKSGVQPMNVDSEVSGNEITPPRLPKRPSDVKEFEEDFNKFMSDSEDQRDKLIEDATH